jgi:hypothetical protein
MRKQDYIQPGEHEIVDAGERREQEPDLAVTTQRPGSLLEATASGNVNLEQKKSKLLSEHEQKR